MVVVLGTATEFCSNKSYAVFTERFWKEESERENEEERQPTYKHTHLFFVMIRQITFWLISVLHRCKFEYRFLYILKTREEEREEAKFYFIIYFVPPFSDNFFDRREMEKEEHTHTHTSYT